MLSKGAAAVKAMTPREKAKDSRLRREFHITLAKFNQMFKYQKGLCAICKTPSINFKNGFAVDHCHKTGLIRGLLCVWCNRILGRWRDDNAKVIAAAIYVSQPPATLALGEAHYTVPGRIGTKVRAKALLKHKSK